MKSKIVRGSRFRGALDYALDEKKKPEIVSSSMSGTTPRALAQEFGVTRRLRPDIEKPVFHVALALPKNEHATTEQWDQIVRTYLKKMGYPDDTLYVAIRHNDTDYDHIHIIASRVSLSSSVWHGQWEAFTSIKMCQQIEREMGLTITPGLHLDGPKSVKTGTKQEVYMVERTGQDASRSVLQGMIGEVLYDLEDSISVPDFVSTLELLGVGVQARMSPGGQLQGLSFEYDGVAFSGRQLGSDYGWKGLQERGVKYDRDRDFQAMQPYMKESPADPRDVLKELLEPILDELNGPISAIEFCERVQATGIEVSANLANTGRLKGFNFGIDGDRFSGSKIGKRFAWLQLQKEGVVYEQDGHFEGLKRFSSQFRNAESAANEGVEREVGHNASTAIESVSVIDSAVGCDADRDSGSDGSASAVAVVPDERIESADRAVDEPTNAGTADADELRSDERSSVPVTGRVESLPSAAVEREVGPDRSNNEAFTQFTESIESNGNSDRSEQSDSDREQPKVESERAQIEIAMVETNDELSRSGNAGSDAGPSWSAGFRKASAPKQRANRSIYDARSVAQSDTRRAGIDPNDIASSRMIDPTPYLLSMGFMVKREGKNLSVYQGKEEVYRITQKPDGHWLSCDHDGNLIGDNIALVRDIECGTSFPDALPDMSEDFSLDDQVDERLDFEHADEDDFDDDLDANDGQTLGF